MQAKTKNISLLVGVLILASILTLFHLSRDAGGGLKSTHQDFIFRTNPFVNDAPITTSSRVRGRMAFYGGSHAVGDTVIVEGAAVRADRAGWAEKVGLLDHTASPEIGFAVFKITVYNRTQRDLLVGERDFVLVGEGLGSPTQHLSGWEHLTYVEGSFYMGGIPSETVRTGYIFISADSSFKSGGVLRIFLKNVPIDFRY